jgi:polyribonucleotide nucleotidyltransferase
MPKLLVDRAASLRKIEDATGGIIHVKAPGLLSLFASSSKAYAELEEHVSAASGAFLVPNRVYRAEVMAVLDFGAFVRLPKCDVEAMLHISEVKDERIGSINDELAVGDLIDVMYLGQDDQGGLRVSKRRVGGEPQTRRRRGG